MDVDQLLRTAGATWRDQRSAPVRVPPLAQLDTGSVRPPARPGLRVVAAAAVVVAATATAVWLWPRAAAPGPLPVGSTADPGPTASATGPATSPPASSPARAADCSGARLEATLGSAGPTNGNENVWILLHNTGGSPCWLGGLPPLSGVHPDGTAVTLPFAASTDPGYADPGPVTGPGNLAPGGYGTFHLTVGLNDCPKFPGHFETLRIGLGTGGYVDMPYPVELTMGCLGYETQAGPIPSPGAIPGR